MRGSGVGRHDGDHVAEALKASTFTTRTTVAEAARWGDGRRFTSRRSTIEPDPPFGFLDALARCPGKADTLP